MLSKYWAPSHRALAQTLPMDMPMISVDVSQAFYHLLLNPASAMQLFVSDRKLVYYFQKTLMISVSAPFSSVSSQLPLQLDYLVTRIFGLLLIGMTSSFATQALITLTQLASVCCFLESFGVRINFDKHTPSPVEEIKFLGLKFTGTDMTTPDEKWIESKQVIKQIDCNQCYDVKMLQRLTGCVNFGIPFTTYSNHVLQPLHAAVVNKKDFPFSVPYEGLLYKMCWQGVKWKLQPKDSVSIPKLVTDAMLEVGAISHIIGGLSSFHCAGPNPIHIQELSMALVAVSLIEPWSLICNSTFICRQKFSSLPWRFAL